MATAESKKREFFKQDILKTSICFNSKFHQCNNHQLAHFLIKGNFKQTILGESIYILLFSVIFQYLIKHSRPLIYHLGKPGRKSLDQSIDTLIMYTSAKNKIIMVSQK